MPTRDPAYVNTGGEGGVGSTAVLRTSALSLLNAVCRCVPEPGGAHPPRSDSNSSALNHPVSKRRLPGFKHELGEYGAVPIMIAIIQEPVLPAEQGTLGVSIEQAIKLRQDALCVLSSLCSDCEPNQVALARERGIGTLRNLLQYSPMDPDRSETMLVAVLGAIFSLLSSQLSHFLCLVCVHFLRSFVWLSLPFTTCADCLWNAVLGFPRNASRFLALDGLSALLSLLEFTPAVLHGQILGCVCDVCEVRHCLSSTFHCL